MAKGRCDVIEALEHEWRDALLSKDVDRLSALVHPDFVLIGSRSTGPFRMERDEWLEAIQRREVEDIELEVQDSASFSDTIIGTVFAKWKLKYLGRTIEDCVVLTDVWVREGDKWLAIRRHSSPSPTGGCGKA